MKTDKYMSHIIYFLSCNDEEKHAKSLYEYYNHEETDKLDKLLFTDIKYGEYALIELVNTGFCFLNNVTINIIATASYKFFIKYRKEIKQIHHKTFAAKQHIGQYDRIIVGYDGRPDSKRWAEIFCKVFYSKDWFVCLTPVPVTPAYISYTAGSGLYRYGVMISGEAKNALYNGIKLYFDDGCPMHPPFNQYLNEFIKEREFTRNIEKYSPENFDFTTSLRIFATAYTPRIHLVCWKKFKVIHMLDKDVLTIYCLQNSVRVTIESGLRYYHLDGTAAFYPAAHTPTCEILQDQISKAQIKNKRIMNEVLPENFFGDEITDYAEKLRSRCILIIGPEGMRCCFGYRLEGKWYLAKTEELVALFLKWLDSKLPHSKIFLISTYLTSNFALISSYKFSVRYKRLYYKKSDRGRSYDYSHTLCNTKKFGKEHHNTFLLFFDEDSKFLMHKGREASAGHVAVLLSGISQLCKLNEEMHKVRNEIEECTTILKTYILKNIEEKIENVVKKKCIEYKKDIVLADGMYSFALNSDVAIYFADKDGILHIIVYFNEDSRPNKDVYVKMLIYKYFRISNKKHSIPYFFRKKWLRERK